MIATGPYNSPLALGVRPWACLFWSLWATWCIHFVVQVLFSAIAPEYLAAAASLSSEYAREFWVMLTVGAGASLIMMMSWSEFIGASPFAGSMRMDRSNAWLAVTGGPAILLGSTFIVSSLFSNGDPAWMIRGDIDLGLFLIENAGILLFTYVVLIGPILEEVTYRGIGMGCLLARGWDAGNVILLTAIIFTLTHTQYHPLALIPVFISGVFLGWLRVKTGTVAAPMAAHISANAVQAFLT